MLPYKERENERVTEKERLGERGKERERWKRERDKGIKKWYLTR